MNIQKKWFTIESACKERVKGKEILWVCLLLVLKGKTSVTSTKRNTGMGNNIP